MTGNHSLCGGTGALLITLCVNFTNPHQCASTVLSRLRGGVHSGPIKTAPEPSSVAATMLQQAAAGRNDPS